MRRVCVALASFVRCGAAGFASLPSGVPSPDVAYTTDLSRIRNQVNPEAECWDLLNQRWTQVVSEKDTGGLVTVMKVDLPNGCKQLAHVHCGLHEAFYKLDDNGYAIWASASNGAWWEVAPVKGDFSYAPMGQGHGYTNGDVSSCSGDANVAGYTASSFTSHLVIKMPGFEHETRARTVPSASPAGNATCDLMANRIESGYSDAAKAAISAYGKTDPKFIPALLDLREGHVYAPADVKPVHYVHAADKAAETPDLASYKAFGVPTKVRRLMSSTEWKPAATAGRDTIGTGGVAQMNEVQFGGDASAWGTPTPNGFDVFIVVEGTIELVTFGASSVNLEPISGFVMKQASTAPYKYNCKTSGGCKLLHLIPSIQFALEFMQNPAYGLCAPGVANNKTSHCISPPPRPVLQVFRGPPSSRTPTPATLVHHRGAQARTLTSAAPQTTIPRKRRCTRTGPTARPRPSSQVPLCSRAVWRRLSRQASQSRAQISPARSPRASSSRCRTAPMSSSMRSTEHARWRISIKVWSATRLRGLWMSPPRSSLRGRTKVAKVGPLPGRGSNLC